MNSCQDKTEGKIILSVSITKSKCPIGEKVGEQNSNEKRIPVLSCEGACIRGEIARLSANYLAKHENYRRGCHGELFTVPGSAMACWIRDAEKIVCIDGCFLKCHSRILENMLPASRLAVFDAHSFHKKYSDVFYIDDVPEEERKQVAAGVAAWVLKAMEENRVPLNSGDSCGGTRS
jgi:uncharacterized metal-binding protein